MASNRFKCFGWRFLGLFSGSPEVSLDDSIELVTDENKKCLGRKKKTGGAKRFFLFFFFFFGGGG